jgi:D-glycero-alpha-D-manno-heptose-7-phosphate kinase
MRAIGEPRCAEYVYPSFNFDQLRRAANVSWTIVTRAPARIDFGGGWTDVPPYSNEVGGFVCNVAIARYATISLAHGGTESGLLDGSGGDRAIITAAARRFHVTDARVAVTSDFPVGAGLGGSSAVGVAAVAAFAALSGREMNPAAIAELSRDIECADVGIAGGRQDHYAAAYGGALGLRFSARGVEVRSITLSEKMRHEIERRCFIVYTGQSRISGETITAVMDAYAKRDPRVLNSLKRMREIAEEMAEALAHGAFEKLGVLVTEQWMHQRALHPAIPTPLIDEIIAHAQGHGAIGAKALGASGGGCVLVMARQDRIDAVRAAIEPMGEVLPFTIARDGVEQCA